MNWTAADGKLLYYQYDTPTDKPVITLKLTAKWYGIVVIQTDGSLVDMPFPDWFLLPEGAKKSESIFEGTLVCMSPFVDHVPNPVCLLWLADMMDWRVDIRALVAAIGRLDIEVTIPLITTTKESPFDLAMEHDLIEGM